MVHLHRDAASVGLRRLARHGIALAAFVALTWGATAARAGLIDTVNNYAGPTFEVDTFNLTNTSTDFAITGIAVGGSPGYSPTHVVDPTETDYSGVFTLNIDLAGSTVNSYVDPGSGLTETDYTLAHTDQDYLTEQIYVGPNLQDVYVSTTNVAQIVAFSTLNLGSGFMQYAFTFVQNKTTPYGAAGDTIGGYMYTYGAGFGNSDVKTFDTDYVPEPSAALGGVALMLIMAVGRLPRRLLAREIV
jgi:hypothetical protein